MKILKKIMIFLFTIITIFIVVYVTTIKLYPSFGGDLTSNQKVQFEQYKNFENGQFKNRRSVPEELTFSKFFELGYKYLTTEVVNGKPKDDFGIMEINPEDLLEYDETRLFWFGHSAFLLQHNGTNILIDPMFGKVPAPLNFWVVKDLLKNYPYPLKSYLKSIMFCFPMIIMITLITNQ